MNFYVIVSSIKFLDRGIVLHYLCTSKTSSIERIYIHSKWSASFILQNVTRRIIWCTHVTLSTVGNEYCNHFGALFIVVALAELRSIERFTHCSTDSDSRVLDAADDHSLKTVSCEVLSYRILCAQICLSELSQNPQVYFQIDDPIVEFWGVETNFRGSLSHPLLQTVVSTYYRMHECFRRLQERSSCFVERPGSSRICHRALSPEFGSGYHKWKVTNLFRATSPSLTTSDLIQRNCCNSHSMQYGAIAFLDTNWRKP